MDINQVIATVGVLCAFIIALGGAASVIRKWVSPMATMKEDIAKLKESDVDTKEGIGVICRCLLALMDCISDNNAEGVKPAKKEMQDYLTKMN